MLTGFPMNTPTINKDILQIISKQSAALTALRLVSRGWHDLVDEIILSMDNTLSFIIGVPENEPRRDLLLQACEWALPGCLDCVLSRFTYADIIPEVSTMLHRYGDLPRVGRCIIILHKHRYAVADSLMDIYTIAHYSSVDLLNYVRLRQPKIFDSKSVFDAISIANSRKIVDELIKAMDPKCENISLEQREKIFKRRPQFIRALDQFTPE